MKAQSYQELLLFKIGAFLALRALVLLFGFSLRLNARARRDDRQLTRAQNRQTNQASQRRVPLVLGNGAYINAPTLRNPPIDARDMAATLIALGFDVTNGINVSQREMKRLIRAF